MLEFTNGTITESVSNNMMVQSGAAGGSLSSGYIQGSGGLSTSGCYWNYPIYWQSYPVYACSDKTKKAIEVLKALQAEKLLKCDSVPRFIELVEKISNLL